MVFIYIRIYVILLYQHKTSILVVVASIVTAASIVGLNVAQVAHANTCAVDLTTGNVLNNFKSGNPHCQD
jgi:hypothetical protein